MILVRSRAPLRLGLAGGGTDLSPYCDRYGGSTLTAAISLYAYATIKTLDEPVVRFVAIDQKEEEVWPLKQLFPLNRKLKLHSAVYNAIIRDFNGGKPLPLELSTYSDVQAGSGLGSSSTLVVAMISAFNELLNLSLDEYAIAHLAYQIERVDCGFEGGRQDQYSAAFGGINFIEFYAEERVIVNPLRIKNWTLTELETSLVLYFSGVSRQSSNIISNQSESIRLGSVEATEAMHMVKQQALVIKECLLRSDFSGLVEPIRSGWENKKRSSTMVSNRLIDNIYDAAIKSGALAGKVSGAGGGGFMWFVVPMEKRMDVLNTLKGFGGKVSNCQFAEQGTHAWRVS